MTEAKVADRVEKKELENKQQKRVPGKRYTPFTDIFEKDDALVVVMEIPGVERKDLDIKVEKNVLSIKGHMELSKNADLKPLYTEYNIGQFSRRFSLSKEIDQNGITAKIEDGVLSLTLPKAKETATRRIEVQ
jgi:HSP20 family molecular chaperone IbpA